MQNRIYAAGLLLALSFGACKKDEEGYTVPTTYNFVNVDYTGQKERLAMLSELRTYMSSAHVADAPALSATRLHDMYNNRNSPFTAANLNSSTRQLRDKTATSAQAIIDAALDSLAAASQFTGQTASLGQAGVMPTNDNSRSYLLSSRGLEWAQIIEKGLMGSCFYYQATAVYLGEGKMNVNNTDVTPGIGTAMEHHWDEAFGYLGVPIDFPQNLDGLVFWGRYLNARNTLMGLNSTLMNAFLAGRAAISNKDMGQRDVEIIRVRRNWEKMIAGTAINYLNAAKRNVGQDAGVTLHALSEAYAFIWCLKFGGDATITTAEIDNILLNLGGTSNPLEVNLYGVTANKINMSIDILADKFGLNDIKDRL